MTNHPAERWYTGNVHSMRLLRRNALLPGGGGASIPFQAELEINMSLYAHMIHGETGIKEFGNSNFEMCCSPRRHEHFTVDFFASITVLSFSHLQHFLDKHGYLLRKSLNSSNIFWLLVQLPTYNFFFFLLLTATHSISFGEKNPWNI